MVILERVTRAMAKAAREAASARQAAANNVSKNTSNASNEQSKPGDKGTSSKRKRSGSPPEESSKAAKKSKAGEAGRSDDVDQWLGEIIGTPQESPKLGGNAKRGRRKTVKGNPKGKERQRSGPAGAESSKVFERGESPAEWQYRKWPWDIEERSQERSAKVVKPKQRLPPAVEEEFPDESEPDSDGSDGGDEEASLLENRLVMKWIDDNHVVNEGAEMRSTAPTPKELMGTWRWLWRTNHGKIYVSANCGGIAFRMHGSGSFSHNGIRGRMRYDPNRVSTDACKWVFTGGREVRGAMEVKLDMSKDPAKAHHAGAKTIPVRLQLTVQPGPVNRDGEAWSHPRLLCVRYVDPDEGEVELFALAQNRLNSRDGPRGFLLGEARVPMFGNEMEHKTLIWEFGVSARRGYPSWRQWLGWKGEQRGWYRETKGWTFEM